MIHRDPISEIQYTVQRAVRGSVSTLILKIGSLSFRPPFTYELWPCPPTGDQPAGIFAILKTQSPSTNRKKRMVKLYFQYASSDRLPLPIRMAPASKSYTWSDSVRLLLTISASPLHSFSIFPRTGSGQRIISRNGVHSKIGFRRERGLLQV